ADQEQAGGGDLVDGAFSAQRDEDGGSQSALWLCHGKANKHALRAKHAKRHAAATAPCHCAVASDRKIRSVDREMRWRCRLKVLWTAACMLRKRWADRADLKCCTLRSRRRTA